jgi:hypothetical protein
MFSFFKVAILTMGAGIRGDLPTTERGWGTISPHGDSLAGTR